jgi:hypothetical protein
LKKLLKLIELDKPMDDASALEKWTLDLGRLGRSDTPDLEGAVAGYLAGELSCREPRERLRLLETLCQRFEAEPLAASAASAASATSATSATSGPDAGSTELDMTQLVLRFLGGKSAAATVSSGEILEKFAGSLEVLFDSLNQIISVINVRLLGQSPELETIRKVIGSNIERGGDNLPVKEYLDQIQHAFLAAHTSFQLAAATLIAEVLSELDPAALLQEKSSGLKFGPLRKAELFELYQEKHARCSRWLDSGHFKESLLREFEKNCRQTFQNRSG